MGNNLFLDAKEFLSQNDTLNYINYENISNSHQEMLRSTVWDFTWTKPARAVYFPGNDLLKSRTIAVNPMFPTQIGKMVANIRQFQLSQNTFSGSTAGSLNIEYNDFEDQVVSAWLDDWRDKLGGRENRFAFRKEDTIANGRLTIMNSSRKPLKVFEVLTIQPDDIGNILNPSLGSDDDMNVGQISASFSFEHFRLTWSNI